MLERVTDLLDLITDEYHYDVIKKFAGRHYATREDVESPNYQQMTSFLQKITTTLRTIGIHINSGIFDDFLFDTFNLDKEKINTN